MAKSIRSHIKRKFRAQKGIDRSSVETERLARLSARLKARQQAQTTTETQKDEVDSTTEPMEIEVKKISTSGPRDSARERFRGGKYLAKKRANSVLSDRQGVKKKK